MTGIYPFDWYTLRPQNNKQKKSIAEKNGLKFIPMFTPKPCRSRGHPETLMFSEEEVQLFQKHLEEGYDIQDERYDLWKRMCHPAEAVTASSPVVVTTSSAERSPTSLLSPEDLMSQKRRKSLRMTPTARKGMRQVHNLKKVSYTTDSICTVLWIACFLVVESYEDAVRSWTCGTDHFRAKMKVSTKNCLWVIIFRHALLKVVQNLWAVHVWILSWFDYKPLLPWPYIIFHLKLWPK